MRKNKNLGTFLARGMCSIIFVFITLQNLQAMDIDKYPVRSVTLTISYAPGGVADTISRSIAKTASKYFDQPVVVMNKPGGGGLIALQNLLSSKADGYTFHFGSTAEMSIAPFVRGFPFKMEEEFLPVAQTTASPIIVSVGKGTPWKNIEELVEAAKREPGKISYACASPTATTRFGMEKFLYEARVNLPAVPFKGEAPAALAVVGGHVPVLVSCGVGPLPHIKSGDLRVLLTFESTRLEDFPEVPTAQEADFDVNMQAIGLVITKRGTPPVIIEKFENLLAKVTKDKDFVSTMKKFGQIPAFKSGQEYSKYWAQERKWIGEIVHRIGFGQKK